MRSGELKAPIVIGRDHLDTGSVASPYRETEGMRDGSDAVADWPLLNALVNTAAGASWVSIHNGGGVGIGYSQHAGMVVVADGSEESDRRLERVLTSDPGMGIIRHADAGYAEAIEVARREKIELPMASSFQMELAVVGCSQLVTLGGTEAAAGGRRDERSSQSFRTARCWSAMAKLSRPTRARRLSR